MDRSRQPAGRKLRTCWTRKCWLILALGTLLQLVQHTPPIISDGTAAEPFRGTLWVSADSDPVFPNIDGTGHNLEDPEMNAASIALERLMPADYSDGMAGMAGDHRKSAREISNIVSAQHDLRPNPLYTSDFLWQWGQFIDHDIDLTGGTRPPEPEPIPVPKGDHHFDPAETGSAVIPFNRSHYDKTTGNSPDEPRQQINQITGWIDGSVLYGSDQVRAEVLRTLDGTGKLRVSPDNLLPFNTEGLPNDTGGSSEVMFLAGDVRANEQVGLTALHTLFVREHNRLAEQIAARYPHLSGERIYQKARRMVVGFLQAITYKEFLPALLGPKAVSPYSGYDPSINARIANSFSTAAFRFGHSALSSKLLRLDEYLREVPEGHLALRDAFFAPSRVINEGGIEPLLRGLAYQVHQNIDLFIVDEVRNFLFGFPGAGGFDLAALNIQRGRDHGLPSYNAARVHYGLEPVASFEEISSDPEVVTRLKQAYDDVEHIDLWVGGLAEDQEDYSLVGPLFSKMIAEQFERLRDGDRFFYRNYLSPREIREVERTKLSFIIRRNTEIGREISSYVFYVHPWRKWLAGNGRLQNLLERSTRRREIVNKFITATRPR